MKDAKRLNGGAATRRVVEIRAGEGGEDAKMFVSDLSSAYGRLAAARGWAFRELSRGEGCSVLEISGSGAGAMEAESGGHRIQRVPPTERNGRVHSSTVTVAVMDPDRGVSGPWERVADGDFSVEWFSGTGCGGQNRNKVKSSCRICHLPSGIVRSAQTRSRENSKRLAMDAVLKALDELAKSEGSRVENDERRSQLGAGERSDRRRTWVFRRDEVVDHLTGKRSRCSDAMSGGVDRLW